MQFYTKLISYITISTHFESINRHLKRQIIIRTIDKCEKNLERAISDLAYCYVYSWKFKYTKEKINVLTKQNDKIMKVKRNGKNVRTMHFNR